MEFFLHAIMANISFTIFVKLALFLWGRLLKCYNERCRMLQVAGFKVSNGHVSTTIIDLFL